MTPTLSVLMAEMRSMQIGLAHSLSRYKLKFSPDKGDTMIVQAINLLDELDKENNIYAMRVREWFGWHAAHGYRRSCSRQAQQHVQTGWCQHVSQCQFEEQVQPHQQEEPSNYIAPISSQGQQG